jgi:membrane-bound lytic murein transglycosylase B
MILRLFFSLLFLCVVPCVCAAELPGISQFIDEMVSKHQFKRDELVRVFQHAQHRQAVIDAISTPATVKPWTEYRAAFINSQRISGGVEFWLRYADALQRAEKQYGVPQEIIVALIGVETAYGRNPGKYSTLDALTTLAFDYPRRADFFRGELEQYLLLTREQGLDLFKVQGSYAGALGIPQFMPSSYRKYAVDFSGEGKIDLLHDPVDAIGSVANYLKQYGWLTGAAVTVRAGVSGDNRVGSLTGTHTVAEWAAAGVKPGREIAADMQARLMDFTVADGKEFWLAFGNFDVITRYNNSDFYAMTVFQLAEALRDAHH